MAILSKAEILAAQDVQTVEIEVPEWGGAVRIKSMTGAERDAFEESLFIGEGASRRQNLSNLRARLVAMTLVDDTGALMFSAADLAELSATSAAALTRCFQEAQRINGMTSTAVADAGNASAAAPSGSSTSA